MIDMIDHSTTSPSSHSIVFAELDTFLDEDLPLEECIAVAEHVTGCRICRQRVVELRGIERIFMLFLGPFRDQGSGIRDQELGACLRA